MGKLLVDPIVNPRHLADIDLDEEIVLALEMVIGSGFADACRFGDLLHGDIVIAALEEELPGGVEERISFTVLGS
jgi:hypothetical protein